MLNFLKSRGDNIVSFTPLNYSPELKKNWANFRFKSPFIIVDFKYHPKADFWFDHHLGAFFNKKWRDNFRNDKTHYFAPEFKSCCSMIIFHLKRKFDYRPARNIKNLAKWADLIDSASYKSAKQAVELKEPALRLTLFLDSDSPPRQGELVERLAVESISKVAKSHFVVKKLERLDREAKETRKIFKNILTSKNKSALVNTTKTKLFVPRYLEYLLCPQLEYSVRVESVDDGYHISAGRNPWRKGKTPVNIGKLLSKYGGGGHKNVGGAGRKKKSEILKIAREVVEYLNKHG